MLKDYKNHILTSISTEERKKNNKNNFRLMRDRIANHTGLEFADRYMNELISNQDTAALHAITYLPFCDLEPMIEDVLSQLLVVADTRLARKIYKGKKFHKREDGYIVIF